MPKFKVKNNLFQPAPFTLTNGEGLHLAARGNEGDWVELDQSLISDQMRKAKRKGELKITEVQAPATEKKPAPNTAKTENEAGTKPSGGRSGRRGRGGNK